MILLSCFASYAITTRAWTCAQAAGAHMLVRFDGSIAGLAGGLQRYRM